MAKQTTDSSRPRLRLAFHGALAPSGRGASVGIVYVSARQRR